MNSVEKEKHYSLLVKENSAHNTQLIHGILESRRIDETVVFVSGVLLNWESDRQNRVNRCTHARVYRFQCEQDAKLGMSLKSFTL